MSERRTVPRALRHRPVNDLVSLGSVDLVAAGNADDVRIDADGPPDAHRLGVTSTVGSLEARRSVTVDVDGEPTRVYNDGNIVVVAEPTRGVPVVMRGTRRWSSTPLNDDGNPAIWRFTSQDGGKVVPV